MKPSELGAWISAGLIGLALLLQSYRIQDTVRDNRQALEDFEARTRAVGEAHHAGLQAEVLSALAILKAYQEKQPPGTTDKILERLLSLEAKVERLIK